MESDNDGPVHLSAESRTDTWGEANLTVTPPAAELRVTGHAPISTSSAALTAEGNPAARATVVPSPKGLAPNHPPPVTADQMRALADFIESSNATTLDAVTGEAHLVGPSVEAHGYGAGGVSPDTSGNVVIRPGPMRIGIHWNTAEVLVSEHRPPQPLPGSGEYLSETSSIIASGSTRAVRRRVDDVRRLMRRMAWDEPCTPMEHGAFATCEAALEQALRYLDDDREIAVTQVTRDLRTAYEIATRFVAIGSPLLGPQAAVLIQIAAFRSTKS